jgi:DNA repair protein RadC
MRKGKSMDERHFGLSESSDGRITLEPVADALRSSAEAPMPALVALAELLACCGAPHALQALTEISSHFGSIAALLEATAEEISARSRANPRTAGLIAAFGRLHHATLCEELRDRPTIASLDDLTRFALNRLRGYEIEQVLVLLLGHKNGLIREHFIRSGTVNHVQLYPREVVRVALLYNASAVILVHNHPTGDPTPSPADIEMSRMVSVALSCVGIAFHEHLIVGANKVAGIRAMQLL